MCIDTCKGPGCCARDVGKTGCTRLGRLGGEGLALSMEGMLVHEGSLGHPWKHLTLVLLRKCPLKK